MSTEPINELHVVTPTGDHEDQDRSRSSRRSAFAVAAGGVAAAVLAACGRDPQESLSTGSGGAPQVVLPKPAATTTKPAATTTTSRRAATPQQPQGREAPAAGGVAVVPRQVAPTEGDLMIGAVAASLERLAVNTYGAALDAAKAGALGDVPPAVAEYVTTALSHHQAHLDAWNGVLTAAGKAAVDAPPAELEASVNQQFAMVTDVVGAAQLALSLEEVAAATYTAAIGELESPAALELAGSIQTVDRQHISVLLFVLGMYPVPEVFASVDKAFAGGALATPLAPGTR